MTHTLKIAPPSSGKIFIPGDCHGAYRNLQACDILLETLVRHPGSCVLFQGDALDCSSLSTHPHDRSDTVAGIQEEAESVIPWLMDVASVSESVIMGVGNHPNRAVKWMAQSVLEDDRKWWEVLRLQPFAELDNVTMLEYGDTVRCGSLQVRHGDQDRGVYGETYKRVYLDNPLCQTVFGHSHAPKEWEVPAVGPRGQRVVLGAYNVGHMSDIDQNQMYARGSGIRWGMAFGIAHIRDDGYANVSIKRLERLNGKVVML